MLSVLELADIFLDRTTEDEVGLGEIRGILRVRCPGWTDREQEEIARRALTLLLERGLIYVKRGIPFANESHLIFSDARQLLGSVEIMAPVVQVTFVATDEGWEYYSTGRKLARDPDSGTI